MVRTPWHAGWVTRRPLWGQTWIWETPCKRNDSSCRAIEWVMLPCCLVFYCDDFGICDAQFPIDFVHQFKVTYIYCSVHPNLGSTCELQKPNLFVQDRGEWCQLVVLHTTRSTCVIFLLGMPEDFFLVLFGPITFVAFSLFVFKFGQQSVELVTVCFNVCFITSHLITV